MGQTHNATVDNAFFWKTQRSGMTHESGSSRRSVVLEQGPAATEEAASFGGKKSFGGENLRQSYNAIAHFQLESRAENHDF